MQVDLKPSFREDSGNICGLQRGVVTSIDLFALPSRRNCKHTKRAKEIPKPDITCIKKLAS